MNQADSEIIRGILSKGHEEASEKEADLVIFNTCGVVEKTERKIIKEADKAKKEGKRIIISGCLPLISKEACERASDGILGPANIDSIEELVKKIINDGKASIVEDNDLDKSGLSDIKKKTAKESCSAIVAISEGCLGGCSYCATRFARKKLKSFSIENIIKEIERNVSLGIKEIQLTSQDLAVYGMDRGSQELPQLLNEIIKIGGDFKVKLGMMNPGYAKKIMGELLSAYRSEKIYKFIHLPIQSGDDVLLEKMNRGYSSKDFIEISEAFRNAFENGIIATDIIVGHPSETEESFNKTVTVIEKIKPEVIHAFKFSKRKGTPDFLLKDLPDRIKKDRSRIINELFEKNNLEKNKNFLGKELDVLVVEKRKGKYLSRTDTGRAVVLDRGNIGETIKVRITDYRWNYLIGGYIDK